MRSVPIAILIVCAITFSGVSNAQENVQSIDLETVLALGGANNLTIQKYRELQQKAMADVLKSREWWLPEIYGGLAVHQLWGNSMNTDGSIAENLNRQNLFAGAGMNASLGFQ